MRGSLCLVAIIATISAVVDGEVDGLKEISSRFQKNYQPYVCKEGSTRPHECKCNIYYKCINNQLVLNECESGFHWDQSEKLCTTPEKAACLNYDPKVCDEGSYKPDDNECASYYKCSNNQWKSQQCPTGLHWSREHTICTAPEEAKCKNEPAVCKDGSYKPDENECASYYKCSNNQWKSQQCPTGLHWSREHTICTAPEEAKCKNEPAVCKDGSYKPDENECASYYKCSNNQWKSQQCPTGLHWSREHTICTAPEEANCGNNPRVCKEGSYKPDDNECASYYKCSNNQWNLQQCPTGLYWSREHTICTALEEAKCKNEPAVCKDGSYKPDDNECASYYKCSNNQWKSQQCPTGLHWSRDHTICTALEEAKCDNEPVVCKEGSYIPDDVECASYYKCSNNQWKSQQCPTGLYWSREHTICTALEEAECDNEPVVCKDGSYIPDDVECASYYKCSNNQWKSQQCPTGLYWNREHTICTALEEAECDNDFHL